MKPKSNQKPLRPELKRVSRNLRRLSWVLLGPVLALLFLAWGFADNLEYGIGSWEVPSWQPAQMWSRVDYDSKLVDPFFESADWSYPWWIISHPDGQFESTRSFDARPVTQPPRVKHTARCFSSSFGTKHLVNFCEARLLHDNTMELLFHVKNPAFRDALRVHIKHGMFTCQYWTFYVTGPKDLIWTTKRQELILDRRVFRKGDVIKGRISFECIQEITDAKHDLKCDRNATAITVNGVFKTIIE